MNKFSRIFLALLLTAFCSIANAGLVDELDTANNFGSEFGGTTATANGDSTVTVTRGAAGIDSGIDWILNGTNNFDLANESFVTLTPLNGINNSSNYDVNVLFFNSSGIFIEEIDWFATAVNTPASLDVATLTSSANSAQFAVRIRVLGADGDSKTFDRFTALAQPTVVPEPSATCLLIVGLLPILRRRRQRRH